MIRNLLIKNLLFPALMCSCTLLFIFGCLSSESSSSEFELHHPQSGDIRDSITNIEVNIIYGENDSQQLYYGPVKVKWPGEIKKQNIVLEVIQFNSADIEITRDQYNFSYKSGDYILDNNTLGWSCFAADGKVYKCAVGSIALEVYSNGGNHACFSADGKLIFFNINSDVWVVKNNGQEARKIGTHTQGSSPCITAYRPEPQTVMVVKGEDLFKIDANTQVETLVFDGNQNFYGDIAVSSDGKRVAARLSNGTLYKTELDGTIGNWQQYGSYCSASISPNGTWLTENQVGHRQMRIYNWNGESCITA